MNVLFFLKPKAKISYLEENDTLRQALEKVRTSGFTNLPVIKENGEFAFALSEGDIMFKILELNTFDIRDFEQVKIKDIPRRREFKTISIDNNMEDLVQIVLEQNYVPVVDDRNIFIGLITRHDILKYFFDNK
jgi:CBS domain-containing protein